MAGLAAGGFLVGGWLAFGLTRTKGSSVSPNGRASPNGKVSPNGKEISRLMSAAVISRDFCDLLLADPAVALAAGYGGEPFHLGEEEKMRVLSIHASTLADFALQLTEKRQDCHSTATAHHGQTSPGR